MFLLMSTACVCVIKVMNAYGVHSHFFVWPWLKSQEVQVSLHGNKKHERSFLQSEDVLEGMKNLHSML